MDILVRSRGKNFEVIPQTEQSHEYLRNETGAVPWQWIVRPHHHGEMFLMSKKEKDSYEFLDYLMNSGYTISKEE